MKLKNPLIAVSDMEKSLEFYKEVLGLRVVMDFGSNKTLTGGLSLQTKESWLEFIGKSAEEISFGGNACEVYYEEDYFDAFLQKLKSIAYIHYVHPVHEHSWGQRAVRIYDPDKHIIEIGENIKSVCLRFLDSGMTKEEVAERMDTPMSFVEGCIRSRKNL